MNRPELIVLVINFKQADKSRMQVSTKEFILGTPDKGKRGILEEKVQEKLGSETISCYKFSLIKYPITLPGVGKAEDRARGAVGLFRYVGSKEDLEETLHAIEETCIEAMKKPIRQQFSDWSGFEIYTAERWSLRTRK